MSECKKSIWILVLLVVFLFFSFTDCLRRKAECDKRGGVLVRGMFIPECVGAK